MDIVGYSAELQSLINRYTVLIIAEVISALLLLAALWILPSLEMKFTKKPDKHKSKRKAEKEKELKKAVLYLQIFVSIFLAFITAFFAYDNVKTLYPEKCQHMEEKTVTYEDDITKWIINRPKNTIVRNTINLNLFIGMDILKSAI